MTDGAEEGRVLLRETKRATLHYLILRVALPVVAVAGVLVVAGMVERFGSGEPVEAVFFGLVCGAAVMLAARWLWRVAKR